MVVQELVATMGLDVDESTFAFADKLMAVAKGGLFAIGAAAAAAAVGLAAAVAKTAEHADQVQKAAQRTGIGVEALQALQYAAERADVSAEGLQGALNFMAKRGVKDFEAEIRRAADELAAMPDGGEKAARAMKLFGKQGAALIPMLNEGSAGIDKMTTFAREAGIVLGEDMVEEGASLKDALEEMQGFVRGLAFTLGGPLLKPAREWLKALGEWIKANRAVIAQRFQVTLTAVSNALGLVFRLAEPVVDVTWRLVEAITESKTALIALGVVGAWLARPFLLPIVAIGLLLGAIEEVWGWVTGKRKTLLEDELGTFEDFKKGFGAINPEDSGFVVAAKLTAQFLERAVVAARELAGILGGGPNVADQELGKLDSPNRKEREEAVKKLKERGVAGFRGRAIDSFVDAPGGDPARKVVEVPSMIDLTAKSWADSAHYNPAAWTSMPAAAGPSFVLNGGVTVNASPGADGKSLALDLMGELDRMWSGKLAEALPAVKGG